MTKRKSRVYQSAADDAGRLYEFVNKGYHWQYVSSQLRKITPEHYRARVAASLIGLVEKEMTNEDQAQRRNSIVAIAIPFSAMLMIYREFPKEKSRFRDKHSE
jgi:hypothetical protein